MDDPVPEMFVPVTTENLVGEQFGDPFCTKVRARLNGGETLPFRVNELACFVRTVAAHPQIVVPHAIQFRVLHLLHYPKVGGQSGGRKLYLTQW